MHQLKTLKDFLDSRIVEETELVVEEKPEEIEVLELDDLPFVMENNKQNHSDRMDPPAILIMRRKSIRQFPNNQRVALYFVDKINKYVTVPYTAMQWSTSTPENYEPKGKVIEEDVMHFMKKIVDGHITESVKFKDGSSSKVDVQTAELVLKVHDALNEENKKKFSDMAHKSKHHFGKAVDFAWKHLK